MSLGFPEKHQENYQVTSTIANGKNSIEKEKKRKKAQKAKQSVFLFSLLMTSVCAVTAGTIFSNEIMPLFGSFVQPCACHHLAAIVHMC